jgi:hypothetical protein
MTVLLKPFTLPELLAVVEERRSEVEPASHQTAATEKMV